MSIIEVNIIYLGPTSARGTRWRVSGTVGRALSVARNFSLPQLQDARRALEMWLRHNRVVEEWVEVVPTKKGYKALVKEVE